VLTSVAPVAADFSTAGTPIASVASSLAFCWLVSDPLLGAISQIDLACQLSYLHQLSNSHNLLRFSRNR